MKIIFGGVRGSGPVSGAEYTVYGGDTTSLLVLGVGGERIVIDAGSGLGNLTPHLGEADDPLVLLLTHYHLDHLIGLPAFPPLYQKGRSLRIVGPVPSSGHPDTWKSLSTLVGEPYWPVALSETGAALVVSDVAAEDGHWIGEPNRQSLTVGGLEVRVHPVVHPGGCLAWRIDEPATRASFVFATDMEWGRTPPEQRRAFTQFCTRPRNPTALIMDSHFVQDEYAGHSGWGHSTLEEVAALGAEIGADTIIGTHHAPDCTDLQLDERSEKLTAEVRALGSDGLAFLARQGQEVELVGQSNPEDETHNNARRVLLMVAELHNMGYQRLRIAPGISPSGMYWRCAVTHAGNIQYDHGAMVVDDGHDTAMYSSGAGDAFFGWDDASGDDAIVLARKFVERFPVIVRLGRGDDEEYARWYEQVVTLALEGDLPYAYSDWMDDEEPGLLPTVGGTRRLPLPPGGEA